MLFTSLIKQELNLTIVKEFQFCPDRKWRADYYCPEHSIAIEVEGGAWTQGRHTRGKGFLNDIEKYNTMTAMGIKLIRTTPSELCSQKTISLIRQIISLETLKPEADEIKSIVYAKKEIKGKRANQKTGSVFAASQIQSMSERERAKFFGTKRK